MLQYVLGEFIMKYKPLIIIGSLSFLFAALSGFVAYYSLTTYQALLDSLVSSLGAPAINVEPIAITYGIIIGLIGAVLALIILLIGVGAIKVPGHKIKAVAIVLAILTILFISPIMGVAIFAVRPNLGPKLDFKPVDGATATGYSTAPKPEDNQDINNGNGIEF